MNRDFYNARGCKDPTAGKAIMEVAKQEKKVDRRAKEAVQLCNQMLDIIGFELVGRIVLRDKKTEQYKLEIINRISGLQ